MPQLTRHKLASALLEALRAEGLGLRDLFKGRQEPLSWFFRGLAYDQSDLDILESGAVETLHAPSVLVELALDELALALANVGADGVAPYLEGRRGEAEGEGWTGLDEEELRVDDSAMLGVLNLEAAPPAVWLDEREAGPEANEQLADRLSRMAQEVGTGTDGVEVHIEGALRGEESWAGRPAEVRPSGVSVHFTIDLPLAGIDEREVRRHFEQGAEVAAESLQRVRSVFRDL